jgi:hypothetical protein
VDETLGSGQVVVVTENIVDVPEAQQHHTCSSL